MAPQESIPPAATVLGTIGTILWCIQLVPQIWHNYHHKNTDGLPGLMLFMWGFAGVPVGVYAIVQNFNIPLRIQPQIFALLSLVCWGQNFYYKHKWTISKTCIVVALTAISFGATQVLLIFTLRGPYSRGVSWPITMVGIIASICLFMGLIPAYGEIWKRRGRVIGFNFIFLGLDMGGAIFSLLALAVQHSFDVLGGFSYIGVLLLEIGIIANHLVWRFRKRRVLAAAKQVGMTYDEYVQDQQYRSDSESEENKQSEKIKTKDITTPADSMLDVEIGLHQATDASDSADSDTNPTVPPPDLSNASTAGRVDFASENPIPSPPKALLR